MFDISNKHLTQLYFMEAIPAVRFKLSFQKLFFQCHKRSFRLSLFYARKN